MSKIAKKSAKKAVVSKSKGKKKSKGKYDPHETEIIDDFEDELETACTEDEYSSLCAAFLASNPSSRGEITLNALKQIEHALHMTANENIFLKHSKRRQNNVVAETGFLGVFRCFYPLASTIQLTTSIRWWGLPILPLAVLHASSRSKAKESFVPLSFRDNDIFIMEKPAEIANTASFVEEVKGAAIENFVDTMIPLLSDSVFVRDITSLYSERAVQFAADYLEKKAKESRQSSKKKLDSSRQTSRLDASTAIASYISLPAGVKTEDKSSDISDECTNMVTDGEIAALYAYTQEWIPECYVDGESGICAEPSCRYSLEVAYVACAICRKEFYCSLECQVKHWKQHKDKNPHLSCNRSLYRQMNTRLREKDVNLLRPLYPYMKLLINAMAKCPRYEGVVYRGMLVDANTLEDYLHRTDFVWNAFSSTTTDPKVADSFSSVVGDLFPIIFEIECIEGYIFSDFSQYEDEAEVVLPPFSNFDVSFAQKFGAGCRIGLVQKPQPFGTVDLDKLVHLTPLDVLCLEDDWKRSFAMSTLKDGTDNSPTKHFINPKLLEMAPEMHARLTAGGLLSDEDLRKEFELFDVDGNGYLDKDEFKVIYSLYDPFEGSADKINAMLKKYNMLGDNRISYHEFCLVLLSLAKE